MRVCIVTHYCPPHIGGIESVSFEQAKRLAQRGHQVTVVSSTTNSEVREEDLEGIRVRRVSALNVLEKRLGVPYPLFFPSLLGVLADVISKTDVCIVHGVAYQPSLACAWLCMQRKKPYVLVQHNIFVRYPNPVLNLMERLNDLTAGRYVLSNASHILAVSNRTGLYVASLANRRIEVLCNAVDCDRFRPSDDKQSIRRELGLPEGKRIILCVRRLFFRNGLHMLLEVARLLMYKQDFLIIIVGSGPERHSIDQYIRRKGLTNCKMVGYVSPELLPKYYQAADIFVFPSQTGEGSGVVILEAYASGLPVVATSGGGQTEIVSNNVTGFIVDPGAAEQMTSRILFSLQNKSVLSRMQDNARNYAEANHAWRSSIDRLEEIILDAGSRRCHEFSERFQSVRAWREDLNGGDEFGLNRAK